MRLAESLIEELEREAKSTARMLARVPADRFDWKPHEKSMSVGELAWHVATMPLYGVQGLKSKVKDVSGIGPGPVPTADTDLVAALNDSVAQLKAALQATSDETLLKEKFSFVRNGQPILTFPMIGLIRTVVLNHSVHHRGQLSVYLRLLNIPVPPTYGRSADESAFG